MTRPQRVLGALILGATLACILSSQSWADDSGVIVEQSGCDDMDTDRVAELVALELASAFGTSEHGLALSVTIVCKPDELKIDVLDPVTEKNVGRKYPALTPDENEPERAVALVAAQLFVVSWLELLVPQRKQSTGDVAPEAVEDARIAASNSIELPAPRGEISAFGGLRLRALPDLVPVARVGLLGGGEVTGGWSLFGLAAFEYGRASRAIGNADLIGLWLGFGAVQRWQISPFLSYEAGVHLSGGYAMLRGKPSDNSDHSDEIDGLTGELEVFVGPILHFGRFVAAIDVQGGYTLRNPVGTVEGEDDVSVGGFWVGVSLRLGLLLG